MAGIGDVLAVAGDQLQQHAAQRMRHRDRPQHSR
jgi:hypothetical protein